MNELKEVGRRVADEATKLVPGLVRDDTLPGIMSTRTATDAISAVVMQDSAETSKRLWSAALAFAAAVLGVPEVSQFLGPWAPVVLAGLASAAAVWSKTSDPRPTR